MAWRLFTYLLALQLSACAHHVMLTDSENCALKAKKFSVDSCVATASPEDEAAVKKDAQVAELKTQQNAQASKYLGGWITWGVGYGLMVSTALTNRGLDTANDGAVPYKTSAAYIPIVGPYLFGKDLFAKHAKNGTNIYMLGTTFASGVIQVVGAGLLIWGLATPPDAPFAFVPMLLPDRVEARWALRF